MDHRKNINHPNTSDSRHYFIFFPVFFFTEIYYMQIACPNFFFLLLQISFIIFHI